MKKNTFLAGIFFISLILISGAGFMHKPTPVAFETPKGWPKPPTEIFARNTLTQEGFLLGKNFFMMACLVKTVLPVVQVATSILQPSAHLNTTLAMVSITGLPTGMPPDFLTLLGKHLIIGMVA